MIIFKFFLIFAAWDFVGSDKVPEENENSPNEDGGFNVFPDNLFNDEEIDCGQGSIDYERKRRSLRDFVPSFVKDNLKLPQELLKFPELLEFFKDAVLKHFHCAGLPKPTNILAAKALFIINFFHLAKKDSNYCVYYDLFTKLNKDAPETINDIKELKRSKYFNRDKLSMFVVHGWTGSSSTKTAVEIKDEVLNYNNINVFIVDWSRVAVDLYVNARNHVKEIGKVIARFIEEMMEEYDLDGSSILPVGFSLGGHVVGVIGSELQGLERIVALDPAGPLFQKDSEDRLNKKHAKLVEVIHTSAGRLGTKQSLGHVDFYPNGGRKQPGCHQFLDAFGSCHHKRAAKYFADSLRPTTSFSAVKCEDFETFLTNKNKCNMEKTLQMGQIIRNTTLDTKAEGNYYLETGSHEPYFKVDEVVKNKNVADKLEEYEDADKNVGSAILKLEEVVGDLGEALKFFEMAFHFNFM